MRWPRTSRSSRSPPTRSTPRCRHLRGTLTEIKVAEGETVDVGAVLAVIGDAPADGGSAAEEAVPEQPPAEEAAARRNPPPRRPPEAPEAEGAPAEAPEARSRQKCAKHPSRKRQSPRLPTAPHRARRRRRPKAKGPCCCRRSCGGFSEHGLDPSQITATGIGGPALVDSQGGTTAAPAAPAAAAPPAAAPAAAPSTAAPAAPAAARRPLPPCGNSGAPGCRRPSRWAWPVSATPRSRTRTSASAPPST